jgi:hypothetical protein
MSENKQELKDLEAKLQAIISIVEKYKKDGGIDAITHRIEDFTKCIASSCLSDISHMLSRAITVQLEAVGILQEQSIVAHAVFTQKDANTILKALRNIISLCDIFQVGYHIAEISCYVYTLIISSRLIPS